MFCENLLEFCCFMESKLKSLGFRFVSKCEESGSRFYCKVVSGYADITFKAPRVLIVRISPDETTEPCDMSFNFDENPKYIDTGLDCLHLYRS